jgi:quinol-cytochrome oxidoreductase complex cytochrome b subunit
MNLLEPNPQSKLVYVPIWLFILFGAPKHKNVPNTVQTIWGVYLQITAITLVFYGLFLDQHLVKDPNLSGLLGLGVSMLLGIVVSRWLSWRQTYIWKNNPTADEKS